MSKRNGHRRAVRQLKRAATNADKRLKPYMRKVALGQSRLAGDARDWLANKGLQ